MILLIVEDEGFLVLGGALLKVCMSELSLWPVTRVINSCSIFSASSSAFLCSVTLQSASAT